MQHISSISPASLLAIDSLVHPACDFRAAIRATDVALQPSLFLLIEHQLKPLRNASRSAKLADLRVVTESRAAEFQISMS
eukprot:1965104-Rhodomonas_salina.1